MKMGTKIVSQVTSRGPVRGNRGSTHGSISKDLGSASSRMSMSMSMVEEEGGSGGSKNAILLSVTGFTNGNSRSSLLLHSTDMTSDIPEPNFLIKKSYDGSSIISEQSIRKSMVGMR